MKTFISVFIASFLFSVSSFAAFSCKVWSCGTDKQRPIKLELKSADPTEANMVSGAYGNLEFNAEMFDGGTGVGTGYTVQVKEPKNEKKGVGITTEVIFYPDALLSFNYPVPGTTDVIVLNVQCYNSELHQQKLKQCVP